jgi:hypothetical protein
MMNVYAMETKMVLLIAEYIEKKSHAIKFHLCVLIFCFLLKGLGRDGMHRLKNSIHIWRGVPCFFVSEFHFQSQITFGKALSLLTMPFLMTDENFFGPVVSTRFIQTGRPSDSGMSEDDNHDITLDSRTFSMHFLSTAHPQDFTANSVGSLRTPDMASKGPLEELNVSEPGRKLSSGHDALTDMSMLTGDPRTYNYGKLSPMLNVVMQKIEQGRQRNSPIAGIADVNPDRMLALTVTEEECKEDNSCIGSVISSSGLGAFSFAEEYSSMGNPVSTSTDPIQEDNTRITDGFERSQVRYFIFFLLLRTSIGTKLAKKEYVYSFKLLLCHLVVEGPEKATRGGGVEWEPIKIPRRNLVYIPKSNPTHLSSNTTRTT